MIPGELLYQVTSIKVKSPVVTLDGNEDSQTMDLCCSVHGSHWVSSGRKVIRPLAAKLHCGVSCRPRC